MPVSAEIQAVFGHFQNLNLLALLHDLRAGRVVRQAWLSGSLLCPVAHGLPSGSRVCELRALGQAVDLATGCHMAARLLGAEPDGVTRFVNSWDAGVVSDERLLRQLEEIWAERLADAEVVQRLLQEETTAYAGAPEPEGGKIGFSRGESCPGSHEVRRCHRFFPGWTRFSRVRQSGPTFTTPFS